LDTKEVVIMKMIVVYLGLLVIFATSCGVGSIHQESPTIAIPTTPRVLIKEIPAGGKVPKGWKIRNLFHGLT